MRRVLAFLVFLAAAPAAARIKIDAYEASTLPEVRVWVSMLDQTRPLKPGAVKSWSVYVNGELLKGDPEVHTAAQIGRPMAVAAVLDARYDERWRTARAGLEKALAGLPKKSIAFGLATNHGNVRLPEEGWSDKPGQLAASLAQVETDSRAAPRLYAGLRQALSAYPLAPGLEAEPTDEDLPQAKKGAPPFPDDRVLYVVGDGHIETETGGATVEERLRELVHLARRRGVRIMAVGVPDEDEEADRSLWVLRLLALKTRGTYRFAPSVNDVPEAMQEAADELANRYALDFEVPGLRTGDAVTLGVSARLTGGTTETARDYLTQVDNVMSRWQRLMDRIADTWERWPWWARSLVILGVCLILAVIALIIVLRRVRRRARARKAAADARAAALSARKPCAVCGRMMMPDWKECLFCAQTRAAEAPKRFRLTGKSGVWAGHSVRFDKELITLGAADHCDVQVPERGVASEHCGLRDRGGTEFVLTDFNTDLGTWLNGQRITQARIGEGDTIRIGETEFVFGIEAE
jgi:hypothetical protein